MAKKDDGYDLWKVLFNVGLIILAVTILPGLVIVLYAALTHTNTLIDGSAYAIGSLITSALAIIIYSSIKMAQRK